MQFDDPQRHLLLGGGYTRLLARRPTDKVRAVGKLWFRFHIEARYRAEIYNLGSGYPFSTATIANYDYAPADLSHWLSAGYATQAASERHSPLSVGFSDANLYPDAVTGT